MRNALSSVPVMVAAVLTLYAAYIVALLLLT